MMDFDGEAGQVENRKDEQYVAMTKSWQARNNMEMNKDMGYGNMADLANTPHPATKMEGAKRNVQLGPDMADNNYDYDKHRSK
jgi:hypothetical protein